MLKIITLLFIFGKVFTSNSFAQMKPISFLVLDKATHLPVENCRWQLMLAKKQGDCTVLGKCTFEYDQSLTDSITLKAPGYSSSVILLPVEIIKNGTLVQYLERERVSYKTIDIIANKLEVDHKIAAIGIQLRPLHSSQDALRTIPSLFIAQHAGGGKAEQIFLRGFDIDHGTDINIQVDGLPVNMISHAHGQGYADLHFLLPELIEKINYEKGPYHPEKGNLATAGFVDFKTTDFLPNNSLKLELGSFGYKRISGLWKLVDQQNEKQKQQLYIGSEWQERDGYFESPQNFNRKNFTAKYSLFKTNGTRVQALFSGFNSKWNASGQIPERAVKDGTINRFGAIDNLEGGTTARTNASIKYSRILPGNLSVDQQVFLIRYRFNLFSNFTFFLNDSINGDMINQRENRTVYGYHGKFKKVINWKNYNLTSSLGTGLRWDEVKDIGLYNTPARNYLSTVQQGSIREQNLFFYFQQQLELNQKFTINGSIRFDYFKFGYWNKLEPNFKWSALQKTVLSPKINISYTVQPKLTIFFNNGFGFHSNDTRVILQKDVANILPRVFGTDLGFIAKPIPNLFVKTAIWHLYSQQEFVYVGDAGIVEPGGKSRRTGIEMTTRYQYRKWLFADIDWSFTKARSLQEEKGNDYIPLAPVWTSTGGLTAKFLKKWNTSLRYRWLGNRSANTDYSLTAKGYFLFDAVLLYQIRKSTELQISGENLLNRSWKEAQFETTSRLQNEINPVTEIHYTPGTPFVIKAAIIFKF